MQYISEVTLISVSSRSSLNVYLKLFHPEKNGVIVQFLHVQTVNLFSVVISDIGFDLAGV